jgi:hypothetical protein
MMLGGSKSQYFIVSISILGEINQATLDSTLAPVVLNSAYPFPGTQSLSEGFATLNDICPSWKTQIGFINHGLEILGEKGTELGAVITTSFRNGLQLIIRTEFGQNASHLSAASRNHLLSKISITTSSKSI